MFSNALSILQQNQARANPVGTFSAYTSSSLYPSQYAVIVFPSTIYNTGEYSTSTGLFTASVSGVYAFHVNLVSCGSSSYPWITGRIKLSASIYGYITSGYDYTSYTQSGSSMFMLLVNEGQQVSTEVHTYGGSSCVYGGTSYGRSTFSGFLIESTV